MNIAIVDDKKEDLLYYSDKIETAFLQVVADLNIECYQHIQEFREHILDMDVVFLDVEMPEQDGISLAREIREEKRNMILVFLSDYDSYVWDSFSVDAIYFMRKRYFTEEIASITDKIKDLYENIQNNTWVIKDAKNIMKFDIYDILYVEARKKKIRIVTTDNEYLLSCQLLKVEKDLQNRGFLKPHRSFLVNYRFIKQMLPNSVILQSAEVIPISKYRRVEIRKKYLELLGDI